MKPLVTIRIVTYNHEKFIGECLEGALGQTYRNLEILILDDASTDATEEVIRRYTDPRIRYIRRERNLGLVQNYTLGLPLSKGDLIWSMAGDDCLIDKEAVANAVRAFETFPDLGFTFGNLASNSDEHAKMFDWGAEQKVLSGHDLAQVLVERNPFCGTTVLARADLYARCGAFPEAFLYVGDWLRWFRCALASKEVLYRPERIVFYRYHEANLTTRFFSEKQADRMVQQIQLRLAMLELTQGMEGFEEPIMTALRKSVHGLLDYWMNQPSARHEVRQQLARRWELDEVPRADVNLSKILCDVLTQQTRAMLSKALRQRRPIYFLRALELQAALPGLRRMVDSRLD